LLLSVDALGLVVSISVVVVVVVVAVIGVVVAVSVLVSIVVDIIGRVGVRSPAGLGTFPSCCC
jgi:hypothetical protein